jgi:hypothetical protein
MKTIFDNTTREELMGRINTLNENSPAQWGKMNVSRMLKHCTLTEEMYLGKKHYKRAFIGRLLGKMALKNVLKNENPLTRNTPTLPELRITVKGDFASEKTKWVGLIEEYGHLSEPGFVHPFFGKMTKEQVGCMAYKHADHHLRQFNS